MALQYVLRFADRSDFPAIHKLLQQMTELQNHPQYMQTVTLEKLISDGFGPRPWYHCIVACINHHDQDSHQGTEIVGFAMYTFSYDVYGGRTMFGLELFVKPEHTGHRLGKALMDAVFLHAEEQGCTTAQCLVFHNNLPARRLHASYGFVDQTTDVPDSQRINFLEIDPKRFPDTLKKAEAELKTYKHIGLKGRNIKSKL
ncbi:thialysine N-epsilon-acetyltransferase-like [Amphiura filiformis]|uniref:thialysine N-epsilon-acetyltransferase-like n=1 Tax=Amphiura filiformis TaxID=82378 RepID=UPI003B228D1C